MTIVPRRRDASTLAAILRSPEVEEFVRTIERAHTFGRRGYGPRKLVPVILIKLLYVQPAYTTTLNLIADNPVRIKLCGCATRDDLPSVDALYRFCAKLRKHRWLESCTEAVQASIHDLDPEYGKVVAADSTDLPARANGQRYVRQHGALRTRYADPDASWGHRGAVSTRKGGGFYGYKPHAGVCVKLELPTGLLTRTASESELPQVEWILDLSKARGFKVDTLILDKGYDYGPVYDLCHARRIRLVSPLRPSDKGRDAHLVPICRHGHRDYRWTYHGTDMRRRATKWRCPLGLCKPASIWIPLDRFHPAIPRETARSKTIYAHRTSVERFWSRLKEEWGLLDLRVRRIDRVSQHVDFVVLAYLLFNLEILRRALR